MSILPNNSVFGGAMLVTGTCIGAGMLALPVSTAAAGFYPSALAFVFSWMMMTISAFLMLEVSLWFPEETNLITMAKSTLGKPGEIIAWCTYVLFLYALMTAYASGASAIIVKFLGKLGLNERWGIWVIVAIFGMIIYLGTRWADWVNRLLMIGLGTTYVALVLNVAPKVMPEMLGDGNPKYLWSVAPLLVTSFGFHLTIPSLKNYLNSNVDNLRVAILLGSIAPLLVYLLWEILILGSVPVRGDQGLVAILYEEHLTGKQAVVELTQLISHELGNSSIPFFAGIFALCAILTSLIGVSLGFYDFFADGFHIKKTASGKLLLAFITFLPPVLIAIFYPRFMLALHYAGFFAAILLVLFPAMMVWSGRYRLKYQRDYRVVGGKAIVLLTLLFGLSVIGIEFLDQVGKLPTPLTEKHLFQ